MFDLETALAAWRRPYELDRTFADDDLEELEAGLRDRIDAFIEAGQTEEAAFREAVHRMGSYAAAETEYRKVYWGKLTRRQQLRSELRWRFSMLRNYLTVALRNLRRHPGYSLITILSLTIGLASTMVILFFIQAELSYDTDHSTADRVVRVVTTTASEEGLTTTYATTVPALGPALTEQLPEVLRAARILVESTESTESLFAAEDRRFYESRFAWTDSSFFDLFPFRFVSGTPQTALNRPFTVVLTESTAKTYFGAEDALGQRLTWNDQLDLEVTGVIADLPERSHFHFDLLASLQTFKGLGADGMIDNWGYRGFYTYLLLGENQNAEAVETKVAAFAEARREQINGATFRLQPVTDIHLHSDLEEEIEPNGDIALVYILASIAAIMLFIAGINFVNLTTARAARRAREIGVRKVVGAHRSQLVRQFLTESSLLALSGFLGALVLTLSLLPFLSDLTGELDRTGPLIYGGVAGLTLLIGLLAGLYPALYLSGFRPVQALRGHVRSTKGSTLLRSGLVVTQFALSIVLLTGTLLVYQQLRFMQEADLGFDQEQIVALPLHAVFGQPQQDGDTLKEAFLRITGVERVSTTSQLPSRAFVNNWSARPEGTASPREFTAFSVDPDFLSTLGLTLVTGRDFSEVRGSEDAALILNETAVRQLGWEQPAGKQFLSSNNGEVSGTVVGVVEDFHFQSLQHTVSPTVIQIGQPQDAQYMLVRIDGRRVADTMAALTKIWEASTPDWPFSYFFLDDEFDALYRSVTRTAQSIGLFSLLALFVACLGIVGLTAYAVEQRTKEFGVRKVLGASFSNLLVLLLRDHVKLIGMAFLGAIPLAFFAATWWLSDFAYRISLRPGVFLLPGGLVFLIAVVTVSYQSAKAAIADPIESLRYE